ncbi:SPOR domain-containing protein [Thiomicrospira cyclica]|uniref:Sporulation domain-containing protein n=1 Tax=Thiomicrospira cyclica (strain DSM 14477 / JCM 11371 / ALM1) TaxID=717773 RepID=F6DAL5_THICA|nr:SPOR domain-containing protein [Thiomicrospira cyclica]AEG32271.1 Sporulation domain-containing protein [Thiomicrospira cyclica ALM1]
MARDYRYGPAQKAGYQRKSQQAPTPNNAQPSQRPLSSKGFVWLILGLSLVLALGFYVTNHFKQHGPKSQWSQDALRDEALALEALAHESTKPTESSAPAVVVEPVATPEVAASVTEPSRPSFRFYEDLPRLATVTDVQPLPVQLPEPLWIQAGSFRHLEQAQREQRRLSTEDRVMQIAPIETANGKFYRIVIGPYTDRLKLNQHRNELRRFGADTRVVKIAPQVINN